MSRLSSERAGTERATFVSEDAPEVSRGFVSRPDAALALRSRIAGGVGPTPPVVVLYGPAGTGKTALVAAIAHELARGTAGRRSVLWLNLARSSDHLDGLMQAIGVIERHDGRPPAGRDLPDPVEEMMSYIEDPHAHDNPDPSNDLRCWLSDWACLMVLDDVSLAEAARPLLISAAGCPTVTAPDPTMPWRRPRPVGAAGCPTVLIARDAKVALDLGVPALRLDALDPKQCLALFEALIGTRLDRGERASALQLAEAVGRLPIVLRVLSAARSSLDLTWSAVRAGVFAEASLARAPREDLAGESAGRPIRLQAVVGWVLKRLPVELRESFAWLGVLRVGARISPELAGRLWRVDGGTAAAGLRRLAQVGLIDPVGSAGQAPARYRLHEAIRGEAWDLATAPVEPASPDGLPGLGLSPSVAHRELLARLRDGGPEATWPAVAAALDLIDDLAWHMEQAGRPEDVDALLGEETPDGDNAWFLAHELGSDRRGYLCDVVRAGRRAGAAVQAGGGAAAVAAQCRYALYRASAAAKWPDEHGTLPALMVASGRWAPGRAEAAIRQIRHDWTRMSAWMALARHLEQPAREHATRAALDEAMRQPKPEDRARALLEVMPVLSLADRDAVLREAVELVQQAMRERSFSTWSETTLIEVVPHLDDSGRADLLRLLVDSPGNLYGSRLVTLMRDLAARLGPDDYRDAVRLVLDGYRGELSWLERARILSPLGPPSDPRAHRDGLREALDEARETLRHAVAQSESVSAFYKEHGPAAHVSYIPINFIGFFSDLCSLLAGPGFDDLREEALLIAQAGGARYRVRSLAVLAPVMGPGRSREVAALALRACRDLDFWDSEAESLFSLLPLLDGHERREAWRLSLKCVRSGRLTGYPSLPPADVLATLDGGELEDLLEAIRESSATGERPSHRPWLDVVPFLSEPRRREFLRDFPLMDDEGARGSVLRAALPFLGSRLRPEWSARLVEAARSLRTTAVRAQLLAALLPHLDGSEREAVLAEVLDGIRRLGERQDRVRVVRQLAEHLSGTERGAVLAGLLEVNRTRVWVDENDRNLEPLELSALLAPGIDPASRRSLLLEALREVRTDADRVQPHVQYELANALLALVPCLAEPPLEDVRREALLIARSLPPGPHRASAVISLLLAPGAAGLRAGLDEALETARELDDKMARAGMLVRVAEVLDRETRDAVAHEALAVARSISEDEGYFKPLGIDGRARVLTAVLPVLGAPERDDLARELFEVVRAMPDDRWRTLAFKDLVTYLDEDQRRDLVQDARRTALQTTDFMARAEALKLVGPTLDDVELLSASARAREERIKWYPDEAMESDARAMAVMPPDVLGPTWQRWLREKAPGTRPELCGDLAAMMPVVAALGGPEAVFGLTLAVLDVGRWWP